MKREIALYVAGYITIISIIWIIGNMAAKSVKDFEIIRPEQGVKCVVVSRMFNTSVDCWKIND